MLFGSKVNYLSKNKRALSKYSVGSQEPGLAFDFIDNVYQKDQNKTVNFDGAITHARSGNATMTDGYGPELVVNGGFESGTDSWTASNAVVSVVDNQIVVDDTANAGSDSQAYQDITTEVGKTYYLTFNKISTTSAFWFGVGASPSYTSIHYSGSLGTTKGQQTLAFTATSTTTRIALISSGTGVTVYDNVSVREMPVIKWAPHNLLSHSEQFDNAAWTKSNSATVTANQATAPDGTLTADKITFTDDELSRVQQPENSLPSAEYTYRVWLRADSAMTVRFGDASDLGDVSLTTEWQLFEHTRTGSGPNFTLRNESLAGAKSFYAWGAHVYRSDLGGMVDNPDQPLSRASYVPTTSSAVYLPRIGHHVYNGSAWANEGLLAESEARTNILNYSHDFTLDYSVLAASITPNDAVSPSGQEDATLLYPTNTTGLIFKSTGLSSGQHMSCFVKPAGFNWIALGTNTNDDDRAFFDISNGVIGSVGVNLENATIQEVGNGWYRCSVGTTATSGGTAPFALWAVDGDAPFSITPSGTNGVHIYGAQVETSASTPSSLIPTSGSSVTRAAESFTIPSANLPWPQPVYTGSELVTNGGFDSGDLTGFTDSSTGSGSVAVVSNQLQLTSAGASDRGFVTSDNFTTTAGSVYLIQFNYVNKGGSSRLQLQFRDAGGILIDAFPIDSTGIKSFHVKADRNLSFVSLNNYGTGTATIDNISVREIDPLSVSIAMDGRMTYADEGAYDTVEYYRWHKDAENYIEGTLTTNSTFAGRLIFISKANNDYQQRDSDSSDVYAPNILVPFDIASRQGSTFINAAQAGIAYVENTSPVALPDLSATDLNLAYNYMGTIGTFRVWDRDIGDDGLVEATNPSLEPSLSLTFEGTGTNSFVVNDWSE